MIRTGKGVVIVNSVHRAKLVSKGPKAAHDDYSIVRLILRTTGRLSRVCVRLKKYVIMSILVLDFGGIMLMMQA